MAKPTAKNSPASFLVNLKDWQALSVIAAAVLVFFRDILLQKAFFWEDFLYYFYPVRTFAAVSLASGEIPLWNPYTFNGTPFLADIQTAVFYVPNLLLTLFVTDGRLPPFWLELSIILHYVLAGGGMYYLAKSYDLENIFALFAGLVFALCGFMVAHAIHQVVINQVAWLPLTILLFRKTLKQRSLLKMILTGLVLGHSVLAGFPQLTLYIFFFVFLIFLFEFYSTMKDETFSRAAGYLPFAAGVIIIAVALTAIQLLPTLELAPLSQRAEITYEKSLESSMEWRQLITMFVPAFFGSHGAHGSTFWLSNGYSHYWETCCYLGVAPLLFLVFASRQIRSERTIAFLFGIMAFSFLYAVGNGFVLHRLFFKFVPGFDEFRAVGRMTLLLSVAGSLLAGFGMRTMVGLAQSNKALCRKYLIAAAGAAVVFWIAVQMGFLQRGGESIPEQSIHQIASSATTTSVVILLAACGLAFLYLRGFFSLPVAAALMVGFQVIDINIFGFDQNNGSVNPVDYYYRTESLVNYLKEDGKRELFRVNSRQGGNMIFDRNQGMIDRIFLMEGYTPLVLQRAYPPVSPDLLYYLMNVKYRVAVDEQRRTISLRRVEQYLPRAFMVYKTATFKNEDSLTAFMESSAFDPTRVAALEEDTPIHPDTVINADHWSAVVTSYRINNIFLDVSTPMAGLLILSEIQYPGWNAYVDGTRHTIYRANWNQRAIPISTGMHRVQVRFEPESFQRGAWITVVTIGVSIGGIGFSALKKRRKDTETT